MRINKWQWSLADSAFLAAGIIYVTFLYLRLHYTGIYMGSFGELRWDWLELGYYMAEAALVGSFADWFAVTAVFEVPWLCKLLPYVASHTAILPRNRDGFVHGCSKMVQQEFLTKKTLLQQRRKLAIVDELLQYLAGEQNKQRVEKYLTEFAEGVLRKLDTVDLSKRLEAKIKTALADVDANVRLHELLKALAAERREAAFYEWLLAKLVELAESQEVRRQVHSAICRQITKQEQEGFVSRIKLWLGKKLDVVNTEDATEAVCRALAATARRLQDDERWRSWLLLQVQRIVSSFYGTQQWQQLVRSLQNRAVSDISLTQALKQLLDNMIEAVCRRQIEEGQQTPILQQAVSQAMNILESDLRNNVDFKNRLEEYLQHFLGLGLLQVQKMLGAIVEHILQSLENARLTEIVRSKVDTDMQRIRLNGTLMGAFLGMILYLLKCAW